MVLMLCVNTETAEETTVVETSVEEQEVVKQEEVIPLYMNQND